MARIEGIVFKVYDKTFSGRQTFSIKLDGQPLYWRAGGNRYAGIAEPGNRVAFDGEPNPDGSSGKITSPVVLAGPAPAAAAAGPPSMSGSYGSSGLQMRYQGALERAINFCRLAIENGALKLPVKEAAKLGVLEAAVDRYTALFFEDTNTLGAVTREAESTPKADKAPEASDPEEE